MSNWGSSFAGRVRRGLRRSLEGAAAGLATRSTRFLSRPSRWSLRRCLEEEHRLDLPGHEIRMVGGTQALLQRSYACAKEPETVQWLRNTLRDEDVFFDVGANVGAYSLVAAALRGCRIVAFEPSPETFAVLVRNLSLNALRPPRVMAVPLALGGATEVVTLALSSADAGAALHQTITGRDDRPASDAARAGDAIAALSMTLDDWIAWFGGPAPSLIKIDVDGCEEAVLQGAAATLARPELRSILVEVEEHGAQRERVISRILERGFSLRSEHVHPPGGISNVVFAR